MRGGAVLRLVEPIVAKKATIKKIEATNVQEDLDGTFDFQAFQHYLLGVRTLLIEVLRRAAFDWILYKNSQKMSRRRLAQDAYVWLFVEGPGHPDWIERTRQDGCEVSSFLGICEALELNPHQIRHGIQQLTTTKIKMLGKLPMRRLRTDSSAEPGHDDLEFRMECPVRAVRFVQEIRLSGELFDDGRDLDW